MTTKMADPSASPGFNPPTPSPSPTPSPQPTPQFDPVELARKINSGYNEYSQGIPVPALDAVSVMVDAAKNIDFWKHNPYLAPGLSIAETSAGRNMTYENNLINYGIRNPKINAIFKEVGLQEALKRSMLEIGSTGNVYKRFRTGKPLTDAELQDFAKTYEPTNDNYYNIIKSQMDTFARQ